MIAITKGMLALSALVSAGFVTAIDMVASRADDKTAAVQVAERFPLTSEMFTPVSFATLATNQLNSQKAVEMDRKGDKLPVPTTDCSRQDWPYIAQDCLVSSDGNPVRKVTRVITVERRTGENSSELLRLPVTDMAQR
jgi:hypothetical protein